MGDRNRGYLRNRIMGLLVCPACKSALDRDGKSLECQACGSSYSISAADTAIMLGESETFTAKTGSDWLSRVKEKFKKFFPSLYPVLSLVISPVLPTGKSYNILLKRLQGTDALVLNLGSGVTRISDRVVNVDINAYEEVDLVADATRLPLNDNSVDGIINIAMLEHAGNAQAVVDEAFRVLKPGGYIYSIVPFMVGYHASPHDYWRWTLRGLEALHEPMFSRIDSGIRSGPTSALAWVLHEWLCLVLSFNIKLLHHIWYIVFMPFIAAFKLLDLILARYSEAQNIAATFYYLGMKTEAIE